MRAALVMWARAAGLQATALGVNSVLRGFADEHAGGMDKRRLIHFRCEDDDTLTKMTSSIKTWNDWVADE